MAKNENKLDGYTLTEKLRKTRRRHNLSAPTQALYYELVAICNEEEWVDVFKCSNDELCSALKISEKSLIEYRQNLIQAGLIAYKSGKSKKQIGNYSFDYCKFYTQSGSQSGSQSYSQSGNQSAANHSDSIIDKTKTETKPKSSPAKKLPVEIKIQYWDQAVKVWFDYYKSKFQLNPTFNAKHGKCLKTILKNLEKIAEQKKAPWEEERALRWLLTFFEKAYTDKWIKENFMLDILASKFDKITTSDETNKPTSTAKSAGGKSAGANQLLQQFEQNLQAAGGG